MKIQLLSDLHNEFLRNKSPPLGHRWHGEIPETDADVIILAGDIDVGLKGAEWAVRESRRLDKTVIYVLGNHEFYGHEYFDLRIRIAEFLKDTEVIFLDKDQAVISGVRFIGATLWTDYDVVADIKLEVCMLYCANALADHRRIQFRQGVELDYFMPRQARAIHRAERDWLEQQLSQPFDGKTVVVTHHGPHPVCQHAKFPVDAISAAFQSDLSAIIEAYDIALWVYGHSHSNIDQFVAGTRILSNQAGYPGEAVEGFSADYVTSV